MRLCTAVAVFALLAITQAEENKLQFVQILWRHGDRTPTELYPTDTNTNWPQGFGQLTTRGMVQQYRLGKLIRETYANDASNNSRNFLSPEYTHDEIYVRSDDEPRCLMSAMANLAGMYSSADFTTMPQDFNEWPQIWNPVPVHTIESHRDFLLHQPDCPDLTDAPRKKYLEGKDRQNVMNKYASVLGRISDDDTSGYRKAYGKNITMTDLWMIFDPLYIEMNWNDTIYNDTFPIEVPKWASESFEANGTTKTLYDWVAYLNNHALSWYYAPPDVIKIEGGPLLYHMVKTMKSKVSWMGYDCSKRTKDKDDCEYWHKFKYHAYSGHDVTIWALMRAFDNIASVPSDGDLFPKYAAAVAIELWGPDNSNNTGDFTVKVRYHEGIWYNNSMPPPEEYDWTDVTAMTMQCKNSSDKCTLKMFDDNSQNGKLGNLFEYGENLKSDLGIQALMVLCGIDDNNNNHGSGSSAVTAGTVFALSASLFVMLRQ